MSDEKRTFAPQRYGLQCPVCGEAHGPVEHDPVRELVGDLPGEIPDDPTQVDILAALQAMTDERAEMDRIEVELVARLREMKTPWPMIAKPLGLSKDAVLRRHGA